MTTSSHQANGQSLQEQPIRRSSGRRKAKGSGEDSKKKKQPRRGMGMVKLEQLRLQEEIATQPPALPSFGPPPFHADYRLHLFANRDPANTAAKCYSLHCNACHKKKRVSGEDLGLNIGDNRNVVLNGEKAAENQKGNKAAAEVVAVHRKGSSSIWEGGVMMEYDFFPKAKSDSEVVVRSSSMGGFDVDLSLKLSY